MWQIFLPFFLVGRRGWLADRQTDIFGEKVDFLDDTVALARANLATFASSHFSPATKKEKGEGDEEKVTWLEGEEENFFLSAVLSVSGLMYT